MILPDTMSVFGLLSFECSAMSDAKVTTWVVRGDVQRAMDSSGTISAITALALKLGAKLGVQPLLILQQIERALDESMPWLDFNRKVPIYVAALGGTAADEGLDALGCLVSVNCSSATRARTKEALLHP